MLDIQLAIMYSEHINIFVCLTYKSCVTHSFAYVLIQVPIPKFGSVKPLL